ncbi:Protein of unknown function DUF4291 domain-containing protein [Rozella allomycis CSF55]|uniref:DUF4291 domain-containing protein n=1 Tax=Rozella allomycis (strain CSF55) TaxID=988480 RepID=A0A075B184_ROZAC|nr:Protein of unknown function DUF4291 domain-containing protein [Rozella allomycis CSF55]|eukprot:EPZ36296.1 Protein of unknown function DUF4291 domain-containing protein [Rozella allomycis CSF55]
MTNPPFPTEFYEIIKTKWPEDGEHILASYDGDGIWVYQAYCDKIADYALQNQKFSGCDDFKLSRMSWIKTNFLWMQYRSGWCTKPNQERCLAIKLKRSFFDHIITNAVSSRALNPQREGKKDEIVRLQWDPDHDPEGSPLTRKAIQLGLRGNCLKEYAEGGYIIEIFDMTPFVKSQRQYAIAKEYRSLRVPAEKVIIR